MKIRESTYPEAALRDFALVKETCGGNDKAFGVLVSLYEKKVRALGISFFHNHHDCDDFVQDVFIKTYTNLQSFRFKSRFSTWLMRIAYNTAINSVKRRKEYVPLSESAEVSDTDYSPEERELRRMAAQAIRQAVKELPVQGAVCIDLYFFYDFPYNELSVITGWPVNTVKSHIFRAKKMLKQKLENLIQP